MEERPAFKEVFSAFFGKRNNKPMVSCADGIGHLPGTSSACIGIEQEEVLRQSAAGECGGAGINRFAGKKKMLGFTFLLLLCINAVFAQEQASKKKMAFAGYSGGMLFHTGYLKGGSFDLYNPQGDFLQSFTIEGMPIGLGGALRFQFGKHLRIGGEGYASSIRYNNNESYMRIGRGGILADCVWQTGRWMPYAGAAIGGGSVKNLTLLEETKEDFVTEQYTSYRRFSIFTITPFAGVEFALTPKINLVFMADYQFELSKNAPDFASGARFYIGIMFNRVHRD